MEVEQRVMMYDKFWLLDKQHESKMLMLKSQYMELLCPPSPLNCTTCNCHGGFSWRSFIWNDYLLKGALSECHLSLGKWLF